MKKQKSSGDWEKKRQGQALDWLDAEIGRILSNFIESKLEYKKLYEAARDSVATLNKSPSQAAKDLIGELVK